MLHTAACSFRGNAAGLGELKTMSAAVRSGQRRLRWSPRSASLAVAKAGSGDFVTIFVTPANAITPGLIAGAVSRASGTAVRPFFPMWHAFSRDSRWCSWRWRADPVVHLSRSRGVRVWSVLGLMSMLSAALGGLLFVKSGYGDGGSSAQMGGSFIGHSQATSSCSITRNSRCGFAVAMPWSR